MHDILPFSVSHSYLSSLPRMVTFDTLRTFEHHFDCLITEDMQHKGSKQVLSCWSHWCYLPFLPRDAVRKFYICCHPVSVHLSVTLVNCILQTAEDIVKFFLSA